MNKTHIVRNQKEKQLTSKEDVGEECRYKEKMMKLKLLDLGKVVIVWETNVDRKTYSMHKGKEP